MKTLKIRIQCGHCEVRFIAKAKIGQRPRPIFCPNGHPVGELETYIINGRPAWSILTERDDPGVWFW